ncbi:hypothetical protein IGI04_025576 [Brassica rapa subsp. trilocularis]|uniref:HTH myb-type domain-containing protein n=1 Tax=Brassica rapa subsp. trilocularis TaxID=1813537 RepID=A0ABQ7KTZ0_BRACM|nr:hypothetical protein IGI04_025576 [Brassica rapa subsp. trilocularis]
MVNETLISSLLYIFQKYFLFSRLSSVFSISGQHRCGKRCRLRWTNYLTQFNLQEAQTIIQLRALLGNMWSAIETHLPKRTDNEIKNYWNTPLKKLLVKMRIDPVRLINPKTSLLLVYPKKSTLIHMAQWESARLEAEERLARESKLFHYQRKAPSPSSWIHSIRNRQQKQTKAMHINNNNNNLNL